MYEVYDAYGLTVLLSQRHDQAIIADRKLPEASEFCAVGDELRPHILHVFKAAQHALDTCLNGPIKLGERLNARGCHSMEAIEWFYWLRWSRRITSLFVTGSNGSNGSCAKSAIAEASSLSSSRSCSFAH